MCLCLSAIAGFHDVPFISAALWEWAYCLAIPLSWWRFRGSCDTRRLPFATGSRCCPLLVRGRHISFKATRKIRYPFLGVLGSSYGMEANCAAGGLHSAPANTCSSSSTPREKKVQGRLRQTIPPSFLRSTQHSSLSQVNSVTLK